MKMPTKYITFVTILWSVICQVNFSIAQDLNDREMLIVLDPGHGGHDHGCSGSNTIEKELALAIAIKLGNKLESELPDVKIIFTRRKDVFIPLSLRTDVANKKGADLFISIHCNALSNKKVSGTETFVMGLHKSKENLDVAKRENKSILLENNYKSRYGGYDPDSPEGHILMSLFQNAYLQESLELATLIENTFGESLKIKSRGVKQAGFMVLKMATMPSVLIETGFLTNGKDQQLLASDKGQAQIVNSIFKAIKDYKKSWDINTQLNLSSKKIAAVSIASEEYIIAPSKIKVPYSKTKISKDSSSIKTEEVQFNQADRNPIVFRIQLAATSKSLDLSKTPWSNQKGILKKGNGQIFKYYSRPYSTYERAKKAKEVIIVEGFQGAFIVAFQNDTKIALSNALN